MSATLRQLIEKETPGLARTTVIMRSMEEHKAIYAYYARLSPATMLAVIEALEKANEVLRMSTFDPEREAVQKALRLLNAQP